MDTHTAPRPTGRRKITLSQLAAEAARATPPTPAAAPVTPGRVLAAFKRAAPALSVPRRVVDLVDTLMGWSHPQDWLGDPGPLVWPSDAELEARLLLRPSQRKVLVRAALDAGLIRMRRSPTGRRYGRRDKPPAAGGRILHAYGFDLAPLAERMAEFEQRAAEWQALRKEGEALRREIACLRAEILALVELATAQDYAGENWSGYAAMADTLMRERGRQRDPLALVPIAARLRALHVRVRSATEAAAAAAALAAVPVPTPASPAATAVAKSEKTDPVGPENRPPITTTKQLTSASTTAAPSAAGPDRPEAHEARRSRARPSPRESGQPVPASASALRGFVLTPDDLLRMAPAFRAWVASASPSWPELAEAAFYVCGELGISKHTWGQACVVLGRMEATGALAVVAARHAAGKVRSPGGLLRKMVELHQHGELWLDKSLFGLAAGASRKGGPPVDFP